jgi:1,4-dihydroxy-2-naphthoate octaprenyltransferase
MKVVELNYILRILDYIFLLRLTLFYPVWTFFLAGVWGGRTFGAYDAATMDTPYFISALLSITCLMGSVFILNQIQDRETDRMNQKLFLLTNGVVSVRAAYIESFFLSLFGLIIGFLTDITLGIGLLILFVLSGYFYNYPPAYFKNHPWMSLLINGIGGTIIYSSGWITGGGETMIPLKASAYFFAGIAVFLNTTLPDIDGDERTGKITFGVRYGIAKTAVAALAAEIVAILLAAIFHEWILFIPALAVLPLFIHASVKRTLPSTIRATKYSVLALALSLCVIFPWFVIPLVAVFFMCKWYYKARFQYNYPSLKGS